MTIDPKDIRIDSYCTRPQSGWVARITHIPSGLFVEVDDERSQFRNKAVAFQRLTELLEATMAEGPNVNKQQQIMQEMREAVTENLTEIIKELVEWQDTGLLKVEDSYFRATVHILDPILSYHDASRVVEKESINQCMRVYLDSVL